MLRKSSIALRVNGKFLVASATLPCWVVSELNCHYAEPQTAALKFFIGTLDMAVRTGSAPIWTDHFLPSVTVKLNTVVLNRPTANPIHSPVHSFGLATGIIDDGRCGTVRLIDFERNTEQPHPV